MRVRWRLPALLLWPGSLLLAGCSDDAPAPAPPAPLVCNGHAELCDRRFDEVSFPATHNAMSNEDEDWLIPNQNHSLGRQLDDGIRAFLIDTYAYKDERYLCHQSCLLGSLKLADALGIFGEFLASHPAEVVTLIVEDHLSAEETAQAFAASPLMPYLFVHAPGEPWPTLREMITRNTRLFVTAESGGPPPAWYHHVWDVTSDTPYTYETLADIDDHGCDANRGQVEHPLFLVNHWLSTPTSSSKNAAQANPHDVLAAHVNRCREQRGRQPTFVAVDFYDLGDLFRVVDELNGF